MTISKKMLLIITLGLGMQFGASAYNAAQLKQEVTAISDFVQTLRKTPSSAAEKLVTWLEEKISNEDVYDTTYTKGYISNKKYASNVLVEGATSDTVIIELARIVNNASTTIDAKMSSLLEMMTKNAQEREKRMKRDMERIETGAKEDCIEAMLTGCLLTAVAFIYGSLLKNELTFAIQQHDSDLLYTVQQMIKNATTSINSTPTPKRWFWQS